MPSETSRLLLPSPNLTDEVSTKSLLADTEPGLGSNGTSFQNSAARPQGSQGNGAWWADESQGGKTTKKCRRAVVAVLIFATLIGAIGYARSDKQQDEGSDVPPKHSLIPQTFHHVSTGAIPLSNKDPVHDLGLAAFKRPKDSRPPKFLFHDEKHSGKSRVFPTNSWYQNLLMTSDGEPSGLNRVYSIPYLIDMAGAIPGLQFFANHIAASTSIVQIYSMDEYGMVLGAGVDHHGEKRDKSSSHSDRSSDGSDSEIEKILSNQYFVRNMSSLSVTLEWNDFPMHASIAKGMPYVTMVYDAIEAKTKDGKHIRPTINSIKSLAADPIVDQHKIKCDDSKTFRVEREVEMLISESDFSWLAFFSEPVNVRCVSSKESGFSLQVVGTVDARDDFKTKPLVVRVAWLKSCSTGGNPIYCHQELMHPSALMLGQGLYGDILRNHSNYYPGPDAKFSYAVDESKDKIALTFDWDVQRMSPDHDDADVSNSQLITFALPHHYDLFETMPKFDSQIYCVHSMIGPACLTRGAKWEIDEDVPDIGMRAIRPPAPWAMESLADSLKDDIQFTLPKYYKKGAGDTYFSGKRLAKLGRILAIAEETIEICNGKNALYSDVCNRISLPSSKDMDNAVSELRSAVEIWVNGSAITPFVYDSEWGGLVSCGCDFDESTRDCRNRFPDCPTFTDPGLDFGNGFYNDHHFHYGYMIYAAAILSHFDHDWAREHFEDVLLLIRDIANPSDDDDYFPSWRQKDWYQGNSWASGIAMLYLNGKNQESSSEAVAAYEGVALYGKVMIAVGEEAHDTKLTSAAREVYAAGLVATATELRSTKMYWHIIRGGNDNIKIYPQNYVEFAVGMLWQTMTQFQTWFGSAPYLAYGIQLMPITAISEARDGAEWAKMMYHSLSDSCYDNEGCTETGWGVGVQAILATAGHQKLALNKTEMMPAEAFKGPAGDGHSLTNTLWYIATRPAVTPLELNRNRGNDLGDEPKPPSEFTLTDCGRPASCTDFVLDTIAGLYSCRQRIQWLIWQEGKSETEACGQVAGIENPHECGACDPAEANDDSVTAETPQCGACTESECQNELLNRCPRYLKTYVCTGGSSRGGCSSVPWDLHGQCSSCCEISACKEHPIAPSVDKDSSGHSSKSDEEDDSDSCPICEKDICQSKMNLCPIGGGAPYLCYEGESKGGCAPEPWAVGTKQCDKCCKVVDECKN
ncbi:hypothetical protein MPSEU_000246500 [Mayamaea pseudoterrestris]|nr:hypothetical protein MPSEU_000246500 [Mayamaea pseudoterrestris]